MSTVTSRPSQSAPDWRSFAAQEFAPPTDASNLMADAGMEPDDWQVNYLRSKAPRRLLCITRQGGKSTVGAADALNKAITKPQSTTLVISPGQRQSGEVMEKVRRILSALPSPPSTVGESALTLRLTNGSRIIALPGKEATIRTYAADLLILDEGSRIPDALYEAVRPMLAVTQGELVAMSTPWGRRGWFWDAWSGGVGWERTIVTAEECPRISPEFLAEEQAAMPEVVYRAEYMCEFSDVIGAVFNSADIDTALSEADTYGITAL